MVARENSQCCHSRTNGNPYHGDVHLPRDAPHYGATLGLIRYPLSIFQTPSKSFALAGELARSHLVAKLFGSGNALLSQLGVGFGKGRLPIRQAQHICCD